MRRLPLRLLPVLALALSPALGGCEWGCSFDTQRFESEWADVRAALGGAPDTLTVAFVRGGGVDLRVSAPVGLAEGFATNGDGAVSLTYAAEGLLLGDGRPAPRLAMAAVGDTAYVYVEGALDLFTRACSPPVESVDVDLLSLGVPEGVGAVRLVAVSDDALRGRVGARARDAGPRLITT